MIELSHTTKNSFHKLIKNGKKYDYIRRDIMIWTDVSNPLGDYTKYNIDKLHVIGSVYLLGSNKLKSLKGLPTHITGDLHISSSDNLNSLEHITQYIGGTLWFRFLKIKNLKNLPKKIGGDLIFTNCSYLESLEGLHANIGGVIKGINMTPELYQSNEVVSYLQLKDKFSKH